MRRKCLIWTILATSFLTTSAFAMQDPTSPGLPAGWAALVVVLVIIFSVAILLIFQGRNTPEAVSRYHLDHADHGRSQDHAAVAPVQTTAAGIVGGADETENRAY